MTDLVFGSRFRDTFYKLNSDFPVAGVLKAWKPGNMFCPQLKLKTINVLGIVHIKANNTQSLSIIFFISLNKCSSSDIKEI